MTDPKHNAGFTARDRRALLITALCGIPALALAGCGDIIGPPVAPQIYLVRPQFPALATTPAKTGWSLAVMRPTASAALDSERIAILKPDATLDYYAGAQYSDPLPRLVQTALVNGFEKSGALNGVATETEALHADYDLLIDIKDFAARYAVPDGVPDAVVTFTAKLVTAHGRNFAGSITITQTVPAAANSVAAATAALQQALAATASGVIAWTLTFPPPPAPGTRRN